MRLLASPREILSTLEMMPTRTNSGSLQVSNSQAKSSPGGICVGALIESHYYRLLTLFNHMASRNSNESDKEPLIENHGEEEQHLAGFSRDLALPPWNNGSTRRGLWSIYILLLAYIPLLVLYVVLYSKYLEVKSGVPYGDLFPCEQFQCLQV